MGNKSKRIQARIPILNEWGLPCGSKQTDAGYSGNKNNRHFRGCNTKMTIGVQDMMGLRRKARSIRKNLTASGPISQREPPIGV